MTEFERNARYSYEEKLSYLKENGYDSQHLQTFSYKGFDIISISKYHQGVQYYFYQDGKLVKMRHFSWKTDIMQYARIYIDQVLSVQNAS